MYSYTVLNLFSSMQKNHTLMNMSDSWGHFMHWVRSTFIVYITMITCNRHVRDQLRDHGFWSLYTIGNEMVYRIKRRMLIRTNSLHKSENSAVFFIKTTSYTWYYRYTAESTTSFNLITSNLLIQILQVAVLWVVHCIYIANTCESILSV